MKFGLSKDRLQIDQKTEVEKSAYKEQASPPIMKVFSPKTGTTRLVGKGALGR